MKNALGRRTGDAQNRWETLPSGKTEGQRDKGKAQNQSGAERMRWRPLERGGDIIGTEDSRNTEQRGF